MRNLYRVSHLKNTLKERHRQILNDNGNIIYSIALDQVKGDQLFFATKKGLHRAHNFENQHPGCNESAEIDDRWSSRDKTYRGDIETLLKSDAGYRHIIAIEHRGQTNMLFCASSDGNVWRYNLNTDAVQKVTRYQDGIAAMQWSPVQNLVVVVTKSRKMFTVRDSDFDPINEMQLDDDTFGDRAFLLASNKMARKHSEKKMTNLEAKNEHEGDSRHDDDSDKDDEEEPDEKERAEHDEMGSSNRLENYREENPGTSIGWRADGKFFAVSYQAPGEQRSFKVFSRKGVLHSMSQCCQNLYSALAWQPSGQWIAMPQINTKGKFVIALFEKDGECHGDISTPLDAAKHEVVSLGWSPDSEVLAVHWYSLQSEMHLYIFLYVMDSNAVWHLKQSLLWREDIFGIQWDKRCSAGKTLHLLTSSLSYERIRFDFRFDRSVGRGASDAAIVAAIDGNQLRLCSLRHFISPTALCCYNLKLAKKYHINVVGFIRSPGWWASMGLEVSANAFYVVDSINRIIFYDVVLKEEDADGDQKCTVIMDVKKLISLPPLRNVYHWELCDALIHWLWLNPDHVVLCCNNYFATINMKKSIRTKNQFYKRIDHVQSEPFTTNDAIVCVEASGSERVLIAMTSGELLHVEGFTVGNPDVMSFRIGTNSTLPEFCEQLLIDQRGAEVTPDVYAFCQSAQNLYRNGTLLASNVTSVLLAEEYLLFTSIDAVNFVRLGDTGAPIIFEERCPERGLKLVTFVKELSRVVYRLAQGELATKRSRVPALCLVAKYLDGLEYHDAFDIMRKERLNLNLFVDHDAERFLAHLGTHFLPQLANMSWLKMFIMDLSNVDVCRTMYESNYPGRQVTTVVYNSPCSIGYTVEGKVQFICQRLLRDMDSDKTVLTRLKLTLYVKLGEPERALSLIWDLKQASEDDASSERTGEAMRYLFSLVEATGLYDAALGMYNLDLVMYVVSEAQMNPDECLRFLDELKGMEENYRKYRIDCHLKRYDRALSHISRCEVDDERFQEVLELIASHNLYNIAIECYRTGGNEKQLQAIYGRYGDHLRGDGKDAEAGLMYERMGNIHEAITSARHCLDWRRVLRLSKRLVDPRDVRSIFHSLASDLAAAGEFGAAATVAHEHLQDIRLAMGYLLEGLQYEQALLLVVDEQDESYGLIGVHLRQSISSIVSLIAKEREHFEQQMERLAAVRAMEASRPIGDSSSTAAARPGGLHLSKKRRKKERALRNLEEPSVLEEHTLIDDLRATVVRTCSIERQRYIHRMCKVALELQFDEEGRTMHSDYKKLFELVRSSLDAIWGPETVVFEGGLPLSSGNATEATESELRPTENTRQDAAKVPPRHRCKPIIEVIDSEWDILKLPTIEAPPGGETETKGDEI